VPARKCQMQRSVAV